MAPHPEDAELPFIRDHLAGPNRVDVFGGERDTHDRQETPAAVDQCRHAIPEIKRMSVREHLTHQHLVGTCGVNPSPTPQVDVVQDRTTAFRYREESSRR